MDTVLSLVFLLRKHVAPTDEHAAARRLLRRDARHRGSLARSAHAVDQVMHPATLQFLTQGDLSHLTCLCSAVRHPRRDAASYSSALWRAMCVAACARHPAFLRMPTSPPTAKAHCELDIHIRGRALWGWEQTFRLECKPASLGFFLAASKAWVDAINANTLDAECAEDSDRLRIAIECRRAMQRGMPPGVCAAPDHELWTAIFAADVQQVGKLLASGCGASLENCAFRVQVPGRPAARVPLLQWSFLKLITSTDGADRQKRTSIWSLLLRAGFGNVNAVQEQCFTTIPGYASAGRTMLHHMIWVNDYRAISALLSAGADVNALSPGTRIFCMHGGLSQMVVQGLSPLMLALDFAGADVNKKVGNAHWPAVTAATRGQGDVLATLIAGGASLSGEQGRLCMEAAALHGHHHLIAPLTAAGALTGRGPDTDAPLQVAACAGHHLVVSALAAAGADVDLCDSDGETALHAAAYGGHSAVVAALIDAGAATNKANRSFRSALGPRRGGLTALGVAAYRGHDLVVQQLIDAGADISAGTTSPVAIAISRRHWECAGRLRAAGACANDAEMAGPNTVPSPLTDELATVERALRGTWEHSQDSVWARLQFAVQRMWQVWRARRQGAALPMEVRCAQVMAYFALIRADVAGRPTTTREYNLFAVAAQDIFA